MAQRAAGTPRRGDQQLIGRHQTRDVGGAMQPGRRMPNAQAKRGEGALDGGRHGPYHHGRTHRRKAQTGPARLNSRESKRITPENLQLIV